MRTRPITLIGTGFGLPTVEAYDPITRVKYLTNYTTMQANSITLGQTGVEHSVPLGRFIHLSDTQIAVDVSRGPGGGMAVRWCQSRAGPGHVRMGY